MLVPPSAVNWTEPGSQGWYNSLFVYQFIYLPYLTPNFDGCESGFSIYCALYFEVGLLVTTRYNELHDWFADLATKAFTPLHVHYYPLIYPGCVM